MSNRQIVEQLKEFNRKAEKLMNLDFINLLLTTKPGVTVAADEERTRPINELIDDFVSTFSFFAPDDVKVKLEGISNTYALLKGFDKEKRKFENIKAELNGFLDSASSMEVSGICSKRDLMETFVYGELAQTNESKKNIYDQWVAENMTQAIITNRFIGILVRVFEAISKVQRINENVLAKLPNT